MGDIFKLLIRELLIGSVYYQKFQLGANLKEIVEYGWFIKNEDKQSQQIPDIHIADGQMEIVFVFEGAYKKRAIINEGDTRIITESCVVGIQTKSHFVSGLGKLSMMGIKFTPIGFSLLFDRKVYSSKDNNISFENFGEDWLRVLHEKIEALTELQDIVQSLSLTILNRLGQRRIKESLKIADACLKMVINKRGNVTVKELSEWHNKGIRQIQRYFKQHFDISPKQFINIIRFKHLYKESVLQKNPPTEYLNYGYFDQAHFIKDFHRQTGITPTQAIEKDFLEKNRIAEINLT